MQIVYFQSFIFSLLFNDRVNTYQCCCSGCIAEDKQSVKLKQTVDVNRLEQVERYNNRNICIICWLLYMLI